MNLELSEEQLILRSAARDYLKNECPSSLVREIRESDKVYSPELWKKIADLGWLGLIFPTEYGGEQGSFLDLVVLLQEAGRALLPLPLSQTVIAGLAILKAGNEQLKSALLPGIINGEIVAGMALKEEDGDYLSESLTTKAVATKDGYTITGSKYFVQYAPITNALLVSAQTGNGKDNEITLFVIDGDSPGIEYRLLKTATDMKSYQLVFNEVVVSPDRVLGEVNNGQDIIAQVLMFEAAARCALALGSVERVLELTVDIAQIRVQFSRPIGSFQVVQQLCADMQIDVDCMFYSTYQAASMLSNDIPCAREVSIARVWTDQAYKRTVATAVKVHGAIGFTREHEVGLHFLNAVDEELAYNHDDFYRRTIAQEIFQQGNAA